MQVLQRAIDTAVTDFYDATSFILSHHDAWNINPQQIIACGSSAGAITALQATYYKCNQATFALQLPDTFQYAGVISLPELFWTVMFRLGKTSLVLCSCFKVVPITSCHFSKRHGTLRGTLGFRNYCCKSKKVKASYQFHIVENAGHEIADLPLHRNHYDVMSFITRQIIHKESIVIETHESIPNEEITNPRFTLQDYLNNNLK